ncbi:MAG: phosphoribosylglycinamide formyltransferase [Candidatus Peribacteraceae bacterium]|nr:phosphoribosylglycinamide formyltransferase [Candidatus Peribacteraceae bacterium]
MKFVILSSARGTVQEAVLKSIKEGSLSAECLGLVSDKAERGCVARAKEFDLPVEIVPMEKGEARADYDKRIDTAVRKLAGGHEILVTCMGWLWLLSPSFVSAWKNKIINVHPSLLPKHPGAHAHDSVLASKDTESGMTIHLIDEGMDTGKILLQKSCPVLPNDTVQSLKERVQTLECVWYPKVLQMIETGEMTLPETQTVKNEK